MGQDEAIPPAAPVNRSQVTRRGHDQNRQQKRRPESHPPGSGSGQQDDSSGADHLPIDDDGKEHVDEYA
jgi:hypothetical protein